MLDIGWSELLLIGVVALIVVGPKDLPKMFHQLGRITAKARTMAREFSRAMEDAAKDSGLDEAAGTVRNLKSVASKKSLGLDALEKAADTFEKWEPRTPDTSKAAALKPDPEAVPPKPETKAAAKPAAAKKPAAKKAAPKKAPAKAQAKSGAATTAKAAAKPATKPAARKTAAKKPAAKKDDA